MLSRRTALLLVALGSAVVGHAVGYASVGRIHSHGAGLVETHAYLPGMARWVVPLAIVMFGWLVLSGSRNQGIGYGINLGSLLALQVGVYGLQEFLERLISGYGLTSILAEPAVWGGLAAQLLLSSAVFVAARLLHRTAAAVSILFVASPFNAPLTTYSLSLTTRVSPRVRPRSEPRSLRGPPVPPIS